MVSLDLWATYRLRIITVPAGNSTALPAGKSQLRPSIQHKEKSSLQVSHSWNPQYWTRRNPDHYCFEIKESQSSQSTQSNWINSSHFEVPKNLVKLKSSHIKLKQTKDYQNISSIHLTNYHYPWMCLILSNRTRDLPPQHWMWDCDLRN